MSSTVLYNVPGYTTAFPVNKGVVTIVPDGDIFTPDAKLEGSLNPNRKLIDAATYSVTFKPGYIYRIENYFNTSGGLWEAITLFNPKNDDFYYSYRYTIGESSGFSDLLYFDTETTLSLNIYNRINYDSGVYRVQLYADAIPYKKIAGSTTKLDTYEISDSKSAYAIATRDGHFILMKGIGGYEIDSIERVKFTDTTIAFDITGNAGQAYRLYQAAFDRKPDLSGLGYWINDMDKGSNLTKIAAGFMQSPEFQKLYGANPSTTTLVTNFYQNVLHRAPDKAGFDYWADQLNTGKITAAGALASFCESTENQAIVIGAIKNGIEFTQWLG
ncbi:DUF4214 domain-containing protein [Undibacterium sp. CY18W]|uniref:DUF4214 domain-containing protein n=1 Tax=Undibacterium hunanense TaxID=2762292 RepID=A0ABR6ZW97_9BURK|nr:DUF4214 domain-containing protein [Undibacterium hunanense]MBC3920095.1 DUF4214 domain-containing protein [Undibacterium hunanense]